ncbi:autorepressor SdpR family transcription factor [Maricaulis sp.]|uniref:autorepressor SdpR family transcription factor n=1 Tax=Maricaulis sp. TaxID=1486257 RepID=UPI0025C60BBB|nr:autorepressor SdpR family transcription factor [Maricaulis sp.]
MTDIFKALSDPTRREVLRILKSGPRSAGDLAEAFPVSKPTMSAHFSVLRTAGLVSTQKTGKSVIYHLNVSVLEEALLGFASAFGFGENRASGRPAKEKELP